MAGSVATPSVLVEEEGWLVDGRPLEVNGLAPSHEGMEAIWFLDALPPGELPGFLVINHQGRYALDGNRVEGAGGGDPLVEAGRGTGCRPARGRGPPHRRLWLTLVCGPDRNRHRGGDPRLWESPIVLKRRATPEAGPDVRHRIGTESAARAHPGVVDGRCGALAPTSLTTTSVCVGPRSRSPAAGTSRASSSSRPAVHVATSSDFGQRSHGGGVAAPPAALDDHERHIEVVVVQEVDPRGAGGRAGPAAETCSTRAGRPARWGVANSPRETCSTTAATVSGGANVAWAHTARPPTIAETRPNGCAVAGASARVRTVGSPPGGRPSRATSRPARWSRQRLGDDGAEAARREPTDGGVGARALPAHVDQGPALVQHGGDEARDGVDERRGLAEEAQAEGRHGIDLGSICMHGC